MPLCYGGGLNNFSLIKSIFEIGFEKIILNSVLHSDKFFVCQLAEHFGSQAVVA